MTFRDVGGGKLLTVDGRTQPELNTDGDGRFGSVNRPADAGTSLVIEASDGTCTASAAWRIGTRLLAAMTAPPPVDSCETRAIADRIDARSGDQLHLVYALPSDGTDLHLDTDGSLAAFVQSADDWLTKRIAGRRLRIDVCGAKPDVTFARLPGTDVAYRGEPDPWGVIEDSLHAAGLTDPAKRWIVFYGGTGPDRACMAQGATTDQPGTSVVVFLRDRTGGTCEPLGSSSEGPGRPQFEMLAATLRMLGLPGACAPHAAGDGTVDDDPNDLLAPTLPADPQIDVGHDDYYDAHVRGCPDLTSSEDIER